MSNAGNHTTVERVLRLQRIMFVSILVKNTLVENTRLLNTVVRGRRMYHDHV